MMWWERFADRRKLPLSAPGVDEVSEAVELRGLVSVTNQDHRKFVIKPADGTEVYWPDGRGSVR